MAHNLNLVLADLVKFLAPRQKAAHRLLSLIAKLFVPQGLYSLSNDRREES